MLHGRITGLGLPANWIVVDIVRLENGLLAEHWTSSMTRPRARHPSAACRCSGRHFRWNDPAQLGSRIARQLKWTPTVVVCNGQSLGTVAGEKKMRNARNGRIK